MIYNYINQACVALAWLQAAPPLECFLKDLMRHTLLSAGTAGSSSALSIAADSGRLQLVR